MKIWVTGIGGCLGSNLTSTFASKGYEVGGNDILRKEEAWRLHDIIYPFEYVWCATEDLDKSLLEKYDVVIDCSIGFPDRPFGTQSPIKTFYDNIQPSFFLLEKLRRIEKKPHLITPSSFNVFYGLDSPKITEKTPVQPSTLYGYTKASVEMLVKCYGNTFNIPYTILRVGSAYGEKGRGDELPHKIILYALKGKKQFILRSPKAKRLWTYSGDVSSFYLKLIEHLNEVKGETLHLAGNRGDQIVENIELYNIIVSLMDSNMECVEGEYEEGEMVHGKPIDFTIDSSYTRKLLNWSPQYDLGEGLLKTIEWFKECQKKYIYG